MSLLLHGDCLEHLKSVDSNSVDFIFCDLPYGQTSCKWDIIIPWKPFWDEIMRVKKINTPIFFTTTTQFSFELTKDADVEIDIFTLSGRKIKHIHITDAIAGFQIVYWNGRDIYGAEIAKGVYLYRIRAKSNDSIVSHIGKSAKY